MKKSNDKKRILNNSLLITIATIFDKIFFLFISILIARYLSKELYGEYTTALGHAHFFAILANLGLNSSSVRAMSVDQKFRNIHFTNSLILRTILTVFFFSFMLLSITWSNYNNNVIYLLIIFGFVRFGNEFMNGYYAYYDSKEKFLTSTIFTSSYSSLFLITTIIIILLKGNYFHFALSRLVIIGILFITIVFYTKRFFSFNYSKSKLKDLVKNTIPFSIQTMSFNFFNRFNIILIANFDSSVSTGIFQNGFIFFLTLSFIPDSFMRILLPYLYKRSFNADKQKFQFTFDLFSKFFAIMSFYITTVFLLYAEKIITLIFTDKYSESVLIINILALGIPFLFNVSRIIMLALNHHFANMKIFIIAVIANIILNLTLIKKFSTTGAAVAVVITYFIIFIAGHIFLKVKGYIKVTRALIEFFVLGAISAICYLTGIHYMTNIHWILSLSIISVLFIVSVIIIFIRKNDIRIFKEALGRK